MAERPPPVRAALADDHAPPRITSSEIRLGKVMPDMMVGSPEWRAKIVPPAPDAIIMGAEEMPEHIQLETPTAGSTARQIVSQVKRVSVYCGRNEKFVVTIEEPPEFDPIESWRCDASMIAEFIKPILETLGVKFVDRTGGELKEVLRPSNVKDMDEAPSRRRRGSE